MSDDKTDHETIRKRLWSSVAVAYVQSSNSTSRSGAAQWADAVLADFDSRFPAPKHGDIQVKP